MLRGILDKISAQTVVGLWALGASEISAVSVAGHLAIMTHPTCGSLRMRTDVPAIGISGLRLRTVPASRLACGVGRPTHASNTGNSKVQANG